MSEQKESSYFRFFSPGLSGFAGKSLESVRFRIFRMFMECSRASSSDILLDVGVSAQDHPASNFFERYYPFRGNLTAVGLGEFSCLERTYPGMRYVRGDGRKLPFEDRSFDWVFSHAVVEHVGSAKNQETFISELIRVSRKGAFLTSPNRLHPVEFHTGLPLLHYLPRRMYRAVYRKTGQGFYGTEDNLNLLSPAEFLRRAENAAESLGSACRVRIERKSVSWMGMPSNTVVFIEHV